MKIAITGDIASGKTTFSKFLSKITGYFYLNMDDITKSLYSKDFTLDFLKKTFGNKYFDAAYNINFEVLRRDFFFDSNVRTKLENFLHPLLMDNLVSFINRYQNIIVEVPLLFEKNLDSLFDFVFLIYTPRYIIKQRLKARGLDKTLIEKILSLYISPKEKIKKADYVILGFKR